MRSWKQCHECLVKDLIAVADIGEVRNARLWWHRLEMLCRDREGLRTTQSHYRDRATTARCCHSNDRVPELRHTSGSCAHEPAVGSTNVVPGSRIFTAGCNG